MPPCLGGSVFKAPPRSERCPDTVGTIHARRTRKNTPTSHSASPVGFITGCSTGFGRELARLVLDRGWRALVTARNPAQVADIVHGHEDSALALKLDVTDAAEVTAAARAVQERFGQIDVLVNNAGYGYLAAMVS